MVVNRGEFVVSCVVDVVLLHHVFPLPKNTPTFAKIFGIFFMVCGVGQFSYGGVT
jgi:hypothetical protein